MAAEQSSDTNSVEDPPRVSFRHGRLAQRKAEEAAVRRFEAVSWLESMAGPLGLSTQHPTEQEFVSCLRSGLVLCKAMNKVKPGAVPKVVASHLVSSPWDLQPLPAYQYFENVRNFLAAVKELQLPAFEASDLEKDTLEVGSVKVVDCILALKSFHEFRKACGGNYAPLSRAKTPSVSKSVNRFWSMDASPANPRRLEMTHTANKKQSAQNGKQESRDALDYLVKAISDLMFDSRENIDLGLINSWNEGNIDPVSLFSKIMSRCPGGEEVLENMLNNYLSTIAYAKLEALLNALPFEGNMTNKRGSSQVQKHCILCIQKGYRYCCCLLEAQEKEVMELRALLSRTRTDFISLRSQLQNNFIELENQIKSMSTSASGFCKAFKENMHLYDMLQELKGHIRVFCRIRPIYSGAKTSIDHIGNDGSLMIFNPLNPQSGRKIFQFNKVFGPHATQDEVYKETQGLIRSVMDGYNVCIFAYGQTGSGKTHTMCGPSSELGKEMGLNYMALNDLFRISNIRVNVTYEIRVQMVEIYNDKVYDLLTEDAVNPNSDIRACSINGNSSLPEATMRHVQSTSDFLTLMKLEEKNRAFGFNPLNDESSHSHRVLTVHVHGKDLSGDIISSCLHLIDLAGRVDKSDALGDRLNGAQHINKSLSCLEDVITALAQKKSHIPYENSKLTQVLQNSLGRNAKMLIFAHVSPEGESYGETISTLNFAQRASTIELGTAYVNKESGEIQDLKNQIDSLKKALTMKEWAKTTDQHKKKENTPVLEKSKQMEHTHPRPRRLSIDNGGAKTVLEKSRPTERTPPRPRRLSIDNGGVKTVLEKSKPMEHTPPRPRRLSIDSGGVKTVLEKSKPMERTPPRGRRLSIENGGDKTVEKSKPMERTPPCGRRLSIGNSGVKTGESANANERKMLKSPISRSKSVIDCTPPISNRRLISEGSKSKMDTTLIYSDSKQSSIPTEEPLERNNSYAQLDLDGSELKTSSNDEKSISGIEFFTQSPYTCGTYSKSRIPKVEINARSHIEESSPVIKQNPTDIAPVISIPTEEPLESNNSYVQLDLDGPELKTSSSSEKFISGMEFFTQSPYTCSTYSKSRIPKLEINSRSHIEESSPVIKQNPIEITPAKSSSVTKSHPRGHIKSTSSKGGLQIRKSIQNISKLINGSGKRNPEFPSESSSKFGKSISIDSKSPTPAKTRLRRQSLTGVDTMGLNVSRRSSLGGK